ncbi:MAG: hypothetical protein KJZ70_05825 [Bryobacterales bacterium]|nr:hypothetical protein [Bryobacterales bacterium]
MKHWNLLSAATSPRSLTVSALVLLICIYTASARAQADLDAEISGRQSSASAPVRNANLDAGLRKKLSASPPRREAAYYGPGGDCVFELLGYWRDFSNAGGNDSFELLGAGSCTYQPQVSADWIHLDSYPGVGPGNFTYTVDPNPSKMPRTGSIRLLNTQHMIFQEGEPGAPYVRLFSASPGATLLVNGTPVQTPAMVFSPRGQPAQFEAPSIWTVNSRERRIFKSWSNGKPRKHEFAFYPWERYLYAIFETQFLLSTSANGYGQVSTTPYYTHGYYVGGGGVILKATPSPGSIFAGWSGDFVSSDNPAIVGMSRPRNVVANFVADPNAPVLSLSSPLLPLRIGSGADLLSAATTIVSSGVPVSLGQPAVNCFVDPPLARATLATNANGVTPSAITVSLESAAVPFYPKGHHQCTVSVPQSGASGPASFAFPVDITVDRAPESGADILAVVNGASFAATGVTGAGIYSLFGEVLAGAAVEAAELPLPTRLEDRTVKLRKGSQQWDLPLFYVSPNQINVLLPEGVPLGNALLTLYSADVAVSSFAVVVEPIAPALFAANSNGAGAPAGQFIRVENESRTEEALAQCPENQDCIPRQIEWGTNDAEVFLVLYGTGFRGFSAARPEIRIGNLSLQAEFAGPQGFFAGLDQVNVKLPRTLAGTGEADVFLIHGGKRTNTVRIRF